ncbi:MAG: penicillin acylase family protein [Actinomycetota bacterium]
MTDVPGAAALQRGGWVSQPVRIYRDRWGIPHVRAQSMPDVFVGQGYAHAMDRLWQMDASRRQMQGRWAEWVGPGGVAADMLARRLSAGAASVRDYEALGGEARMMVDAYAAGVNAFIATGPVPMEYGLTGGTPETWAGWHCIAAMRQRGYLMGSLWFKLWRASAVGILAPEDLTKLRYDDGGADRLCIPPGTDAARWMASLADLREPISALARLHRSDATGGGSNNWAMAPDRTSTGRPLLAGDPHRAFELPGMYAQMHLGCDQFDAIGFSVPGVPAFPHFGHNEHVAWGVTHAFTDIHDLYVEQFDRGDPSRYLYQGKWLQAATRTEDITVRGGPAVQVDITETRHGPVIAGEPSRGAGLTLKSVQFADTDYSLDCLIPMLRAASCDALFTAVRRWGLIDHNLVAADTSGHIGHLVRAIVPRRPRINGWLPVPGWTGEYDWDGMIPADQMPRVDDPERGYLVTANNRVVAVTPGTGDYFCTDAHPPYRARRIEELLAGLSPASPQDMAAIHRDDVSEPARLFQAALAEVTPDGPSARAVADLVAGWDLRMSPDSAAAACYTQLRWELARLVTSRSGLGATSENELMGVPPGISAVSQVWWMLPGLLRSGDVSMTGGASWPELLAEALRAVAGGSTPAEWGDLHRARLMHPLAPVFPAQAAVLSPPGARLGGDNETVWANGCYADSGTDAVYGAIARYVFDVGNWDGSQWVVVAGASGEPASPHYLDQHEAWSRCELVPMLHDWDAIAAGPAPLTLEPHAGY